MNLGGDAGDGSNGREDNGGAETHFERMIRELLEVFVLKYEYDVEIELDLGIKLYLR